MQARHLYIMLRCCPTTGCTVEELEVPRKMLASSMAPHKAPIPSGEVLHSNTTPFLSLYQGFHDTFHPLQNAWMMGYHFFGRSKSTWQAHQLHACLDNTQVSGKLEPYRKLLLG